MGMNWIVRIKIVLYLLHEKFLWQSLFLFFFCVNFLIFLTFRKEEYEAEDKCNKMFLKKMQSNPSQCLRVGGSPIWMKDEKRIKAKSMKNVSCFVNLYPFSPSILTFSIELHLLWKIATIRISASFATYLLHEAELLQS
jgi:hypothetical protein